MREQFLTETCPWPANLCRATAKLKDLGTDKLAQLVLDEAERNAGFRRQVKAALAGKSGPEAIAKLIDRRLSGLSRAKSFIE